MTQIKLAKTLKIHYNHLNPILTGRRNTTFAQAIAIEKASNGKYKATDILNTYIQRNKLV